MAQTRETQVLSAEEIGAALRTARVRLGLSEPQAAKLVGVSTSSLSRYEKGQREMPTTILQRTVLAYGFRSLTDFLDFVSTLRVLFIPRVA